MASKRKWVPLAREGATQELRRMGQGFRIFWGIGNFPGGKPEGIKTQLHGVEGQKDQILVFPLGFTPWKINSVHRGQICHQQLKNLNPNLEKYKNGKLHNFRFCISRGLG